MTTSTNGSAPSPRRPGPKPRGRRVVPLTITITPEQRAALEALADVQRVSISTVIRQFIAAGLATDRASGHGADSADAPRVQGITAVSPSLGDRTPEPVTIVVIDDDPRIFAFVALVLEDEGYRVAGWHTGAGARDFIAREMPAAVLLDVEMETRDAGLQVRAQIGEDASLRAIPVILTSSRTGYGEDETAQREGFGDRTLAKPYSADVLIDAVARAIATGQRREVTRP